MSLGYDRPLYLLPFDHRHSYVTGIFHITPPLTPNQCEAVIDSKQVIYDGFRQALGRDVPVASGAFWSTRSSARISCVMRPGTDS